MEQRACINKQNMGISKKIIQYDKRLLVIVLTSTFLFGILGHGMMLLNFYCVHDGCGQFDLGTTYHVGRWVLDVFEKLHRTLWGMYTYETNWFQGIITLLFIGLANYLIIDLLKIHGTVRQVLLCGILAVFPSVTGLFAYMFTAPYYGLSLFLAVFSAALSSEATESLHWRKRNWLCFAAAPLLLSISIGIYQAYLPHFISFVLLFLIRREISGEYEDHKKRFRDLLLLSFAALAGLAIYLLTNKIYLHIIDSGMGRYRGLDNYGITDGNGYLARIFQAYYRFFIPDPDFGKNMFPFRLYSIYRLILIPVIVIFSIILVIQRWKKSRCSGVFLLLFFLFVPFSTNFMYILSGEEGIYSLTLYSQSFVFVIFVMLAECIETSFSNKRLCRPVLTFVSLLCLYVSLFYSKLDNVEYTKLGEYIEQNKSWYTTLVTRIKSVEDFSDTLPVVYINEYEKKDADLYYDAMFSAIAISPYDDSNMNINGYWWKDQMYIYTGFYPELESADKFADLPEVENMSCYPNDGSIKIVDDTIVVKFS